MTALAPTVLVVDDDEAVRKSLSRGIASRGFQVASYASAEEFLYYYCPDQPSCLLLDQGMPRMTGLELQQILVERGDQIPIIFMSGHGDASDASQAMAHGAIAFLEKPCKPALLHEKIKQAIAMIS